MKLQIPSDLYSASLTTKLYCTCTRHVQKSKKNPLLWSIYPASVSSQETDS